ncbi:MAG TPA: hypothetical protein VN083_02140, partial [Vicinamibacteria bacterium]|nr:hypothetical protein [Vicinamibacteria bacterium]
KALLKTVLAGLLSSITLLLLRRWWAPVTPRPEPLFTSPALWLGLYRILAQWREWWSAPLLGGLTLLAALGAWLPRGRESLIRYGYLALVAASVAFAASVYTQDELVGFFPSDIPRLLVYAIPVLVPPGMLVLEGFFRPLPAPELPRGGGSFAAAVLALAGALAPLATQDRYRRVDLRGPHDGRLVLALCRESLAFASRLERGKPVLYEPEARAFPSVGSDPAYLERMRWFLREGWGPRPQYQTGEVLMEDRDASVLIPCFRPSEWTLVLTLSSAEPLALGVSLNGTPLGELSLGLDATRYKLPVHAEALYRGDNRLELHARGVGRARLHELAIHPVS